MSQRDESNLTVQEMCVLSDLPNEFTTDEALLIGEFHNMHRRTLFRFFKNENVFVKVRHGVYRKIIFRK